MDETKRHRRRRVLGVCSATHVVHDGLSDMLYVLLPVLAEQFGLSLAQVGLVRGAHRAAMALFQVPAGLLAERRGERGLQFALALAGCLVLLTLPLAALLRPAIARAAVPAAAD